MRTRLWLVVVAAALVFGAGCTDEGETNPVDNDPECETGAVGDCTQEDGTDGQRRCIDEKWGGCGAFFCEEGAVAECTTACGTQGKKLCQTDTGRFGMCIVEETCNGKDDDCDGQVDEETAEACSCGSEQGLRECVAGQYGTCSVGEPDDLEICDGIDNNCDSLVDEGCDDDHDGYCDEGMTVEGTPALCPNGGGDCNDDEKTINPGASEKCDGVDQDCDGETDEEMETFICGGEGECDEVEVESCQDGVVVDECPADTKNVGASEEVCDDLDNDCDGETDEDLEGCCDEGDIAVCGTNEGECQKGVKECSAQKTWGECGGDDFIGALDELCDGLDNDCDGQTDEENPEGGETCGSDQGECSPGVLTCVEGEVICKDEVPASEEVCDGKDNDCDGAIDNGFAADQYEENDSCDLARDLGELVENTDPLAFNATLYKDGASDTDWFKLLAKEKSDIIPCGFSFDDGCYALLVTLTPSGDADLGLCLNANDCEGTDLATCEDSMGAGQAEQMLITWKGTYGLNDDVTTFVEVTGDQGCKEYVLSYEFYSECPVDKKCFWEVEEGQ